MSGFPHMNAWEQELAAGRDHIDRQLLAQHPEADEWLEDLSQEFGLFSATTVRTNHDLSSPNQDQA